MVPGARIRCPRTGGHSDSGEQACSSHCASTSTQSSTSARGWSAGSGHAWRRSCSWAARHVVLYQLCAVRRNSSTVEHALLPLMGLCESTVASVLARPGVWTLAWSCGRNYPYCGPALAGLVAGEPGEGNVQAGPTRITAPHASQQIGQAERSTHPDLAGRIESYRHRGSRLGPRRDRVRDR